MIKNRYLFDGEKVGSIKWHLTYISYVVVCRNQPVQSQSDAFIERLTLCGRRDKTAFFSGSYYIHWKTWQRGWRAGLSLLEGRVLLVSGILPDYGCRIEEMLKDRTCDAHNSRWHCLDSKNWVLAERNILKARKFLNCWKVRMYGTKENTFIDYCGAKWGESKSLSLSNMEIRENFH